MLLVFAYIPFVVVYVRMRILMVRVMVLVRVNRMIVMVCDDGGGG